MSRRSGEVLLPLYGITGSFSGERLIEGEGWDLWTIVHRPGNARGELMVVVMRRTTASPLGGGPRVAISEELARESVAIGLVVDIPGIGRDVFEIAAEVASDDDAWTGREIKADGETVSGYEREYKGLWVAYFLTPLLIVSVQGPAALRPEQLELKQFEESEIPRRMDYPT